MQWIHALSITSNDLPEAIQVLVPLWTGRGGLVSPMRGAQGNHGVVGCGACALLLRLLDGARF